MGRISIMDVLVILIPVLLVLAVVGFAVLAVSVAFLRAWMVRRRVAAMAVASAPSAVQLWTMGAIGLWTGGEDSAGWNAERARSSLSSWYGATDTAGLASTVAGLTTGRTGNVAWDVVRALDLLRIGVAAGYLTQDQCWTQVRALAPILRKEYRSWEALGAGFEQGMNEWQSSRNITDPAETGRVQRHLPALRASFWSLVAWDARL